MPITVTLVFGVTAALAVFCYILAEFALASRSDNPYGPARNGGARRARRITGMYVRDGGGTTQSLIAVRDARLRAHHDESLSVGELRAYREERLIGHRDGELVA
jgi:hypothetical protein